MDDDVDAEKIRKVLVEGVRENYEELQRLFPDHELLCYGDLVEGLFAESGREEDLNPTLREELLRRYCRRSGLAGKQWGIEILTNIYFLYNIELSQSIRVMQKPRSPYS